VLELDLPAHLAGLGHERLGPGTGDHVVRSLLRDRLQRLREIPGDEDVADVRKVAVRLKELASFREVGNELFAEDVHAVLKGRHGVTALRPPNGVRTQLAPGPAAKFLMDRLQAGHEAGNDRRGGQQRVRTVARRDGLERWEPGRKSSEA